MKILVTGGPVHAKLDAVKFVTNRFKGGLMVKLAEDLDFQEQDVTYLCSKAVAPATSVFEVIHHDGFHDYRQKIMKMAPEFDAIVLGAAVANLIPVRYFKGHNQGCTGDVSLSPGVSSREPCDVSMPLEGKFPSHDYKPGDSVYMEWQIAPRIIDEVKARMKPGAHLFGFKLLNDAQQYELINAAYGVLLESGATTVFANDATGLNVVHAVGKDHSARPLLRDSLASEIVRLVFDKYYHTEVLDEQFDRSYDRVEKDLWELANFSRFHASSEGYIYGTVARRISDGGFVTTKRGKDETKGVVIVKDVDHDNRVVRTVGGKATLNAPLLHWLFWSNSDIEYICHYHDYESGLSMAEWAPPGTHRDSVRCCDNGKWSFNIEEHGCVLCYDKEGNLL